jgi:hypothetical protein
VGAWLTNFSPGRALCAAIRATSLQTEPVVLSYWTDQGLSWKWISRTWFTAGFRKMKQDCSLLADDFAIKRALADIPEISSIHRNGSVAALWFENHQMGSCTDIEIIEEAIRLGPFGALSVLRPSTQAALTQLRGLAQKHIDGDF